MASTPTPPPAGTSMSDTVGEQLRVQVEAARAAVVLDAHARGVIAESDNPRLVDWVRQVAVGGMAVPTVCSTLRCTCGTCESSSGYIE